MKILILTILLIGFSFIGDAAAQKLQQQGQKKDFRPQRILQALGLSNEQIQQIRRINVEMKTRRNDAHLRLQQAVQTLDQAIYADNSNEEEIQIRLKEVQAAQAELVKLKFLTEYEVRKVLNAEQLNKFRQIRRQFMQRMNDEESPSPDEPQNPPPFNRRRVKNRPLN